MNENYKEIAFEEAIEHHLLTYAGYKKGSPDTFNKELALDTSTLIEFIKETQPEEWQKLSSVYGANAEKKLIDIICKELNSRGMLDCIRHGIDDFNLNGKKIKLAFFKPVSGLNDESNKNYLKNILTITRQVKYSLNNENSIDMMISLNGLPIITLELKNPLTNQTVENAKKQYMYDRSPKELLFQFKKRALVHFAVDPDLVYMTTCLAGENTYFLPFNKGNDNGAGNPINPNSYNTSYLWEEIFPKDCLLDILARFMHLQKEEKKKDGKKVIKETNLYFLDCPSLFIWIISCPAFITPL